MRSAILRRAKEHARVAELQAWSSIRRAPSSDATDEIVVLAGYGNSSYGDYFIGLGLAELVHDAGFTPILAGRGSDMRAFELRGIRTIADQDRNANLVRWEEAVARSRAIILGGGGLFEDRVGETSSQSLAAGYLARTLFAQRSGKAAAVYGVGLEQEPYAFAANERLLQRVLKGANFVGLRDADSVQAGTRFGVQATQVRDPAVMALSRAARRPHARNGRAAFIPFARVAWPNIGNPDTAAYIRQLPDWVTAARVLGDYDEVAVVPFHKSDVKFMNQIEDVFAEHAPGVKLTRVGHDPSSPLEILDILQNYGTSLTMRYHGFMASYFAGIRDISVIGSSQKLRVTQALHRENRLESWWDPGASRIEFSAALAKLALHS